MQLHTIGYEGASLSDFRDTLVAAQIFRVIDIRQLPQSRRPGFSKNVLANSLREIAIGYEHQKRLGDPEAGREAARAGKTDLFYEIFEAHLRLPETQQALNEVAITASSEPCVLLCYERDHKLCHRTLVSNEMARLHDWPLRSGMAEEGYCPSDGYAPPPSRSVAYKRDCADR